MQADAARHRRERLPPAYQPEPLHPWHRLVSRSVSFLVERRLASIASMIGPVDASTNDPDSTAAAVRRTMQMRGRRSGACFRSARGGCYHRGQRRASVSVGMKIHHRQGIGRQDRGHRPRPSLSPTGDFKQILRALGEHGVLCFPGQRLGDRRRSPASGACSATSRSTSPTSSTSPDFREVMVLSNMTQGRQAGRPRRCRPGLAHRHVLQPRTSRSPTCSTPSRCRVRDGRPLGDTQFRNMHAAYEDLPADIKRGSQGARPRTTSPSSGT